MRPEDLDLAIQIRLQIEQERRHGIAYWCDGDLSAALAAYGQGGTGVGGPGQAARAGSEGPGMRASGGGGSGLGRGGAPVPPPLQFVKPSQRVAEGDPATPPPRALAANAASGGPGGRPTWGPPPEAKGRAADWKEQLAAIDAEAKACTSCGLCETRTNVVFGVGEARVPLVFVGEAPGADEDRQGFPFVGRAGMLLNKIIEAIGLQREQVYICNVLKCRPPGNRDPEPDEVISCQDFLMRQLAVLKPTVICTLGRHSTHLLAGQMGAMKNHRGQVFTWRGAKVVPTYHPAALLRNPALKPLVWEDVQTVRRLLDQEAGA